LSTPGRTSTLLLWCRGPLSDPGTPSDLRGGSNEKAISPDDSGLLEKEAKRATGAESEDPTAAARGSAESNSNCEASLDVHEIGKAWLLMF
jgi:hypothetical protein